MARRTCLRRRRRHGDWSHTDVCGRTETAAHARFEDPTCKTKTCMQLACSLQALRLGTVQLYDTIRYDR